MSLTIRRAGGADAEETARVFSAAFKNMPGIPKIHSDEEDRAFVRGLIMTKEVWVALWDGKIVGMMCLNGDWLEQLYVDPEHQSRSVGYGLLYTAKLERPKGFQFWTFQANKRARRFYEKLGCEPVEFTDGRGNEERTPDVRYVYKGKKRRLRRMWRNVTNFSLSKDSATTSRTA
jgi:GNAT superfamily N-acetyltransferase